MPMGEHLKGLIVGTVLEQRPGGAFPRPHRGPVQGEGEPALPGEPLTGFPVRLRTLV